METLHATAPLHIDDVVLIPIQRVRVETLLGGNHAGLRAFAEPRAIVVGERGRWRALAPDGAEVALAPMLASVAGLVEAIHRD